MSARPLCIVPARGGSKRFPRKNLALLGDKPLIAWTIDAARESGLFDEVIVSSEDDEILATATAHGARALRRDPALADDRTEVEDVCRDVLTEVGARGRTVYLLLPTAPLRSPSTLRRAWAAFRAAGAPALLSTTPLEHPPQWALTLRDGRLVPYDPTDFSTPRKDLPPAYRHDGAYAIFDADAFLARGGLADLEAVPFETPADEAVDVDEPLDLAWAEFLLARRT
jgi:pseudaminic acid cytidylyltransferase